MKIIQRITQSKFVWSVTISILVLAGYFQFTRPLDDEQASDIPSRVNAGTLAILAATNTPSLSVRATQISLQSNTTVIQEVPTKNAAIEIPATATIAPTLQDTPTPIATATPDVKSSPTDGSAINMQKNSPLATPLETDTLESPAATDSPAPSLADLLAQLVPPLPLISIPPRLAPPTRTTISLPIIVDSSAPATSDISTDGTERTASVPILMYHYLSVPPADADIYRLDLSVTPDRFAAHLDSLLAEGFQTISLYDLHRHLFLGSPLPPKPVILTFDDGYRDNYQNALPLLVERSMTATFFIVTDYIDEGRPAYITWDMAREMFAAGMSIESHGRTHLSFKERDNDFLVWQALGSSETIEFQLGTRPRFVSYPAGKYDALTIDVFSSANYWAGVTTVPGAVQSTGQPFEIPRIRVRGTTSAGDLINLLN